MSELSSEAPAALTRDTTLKVGVHHDLPVVVVKMGDLVGHISHEDAEALAMAFSVCARAIRLRVHGGQG